MLKKMGLARRKAFLAALATTGNVTLAAERAKVSRGWVHKARTQDPAFRAACEEAVEASFAALRQCASNRPTARGWGHLDGMELVLRGSNRRRVQVARARVRQFSPKTENRFLAVLQATCSVKAAYEAVGMSKGAAYSHRKRWPGFAARWDRAIEEAGLRLELALAFGPQAGPGNPFSSAALPEPAEISPLAPEQMFRNLYMHKHRLCGRGGRPGRIAKPPEREAVMDRVVTLCALVRRLDEVPREALARDREAFALGGGG
jgi:hypothetical protein